MSKILKSGKPFEEIVSEQKYIEKSLITDWKNIDNASFYEKISLESNVRNAVLSGLGIGEELNLIHSYLEHAKSLLEVGAGYGRVLNYLVKHNVKANLHAIERSSKLCRILRKKFKNKVHIYQRDLLNFNTDDQYDLILWLFCGISDFAADEQLLALRKLSPHLTDDGVFILETFSHTTRPNNALSYEGQVYVIELEGEILRGFIPSLEIIEEYAIKAGFKKIQHIPYKTSFGRNRAFHMLRK